MTESIAILGATGSVGKQALDVCRHLNIRVTALSAGSDITTLEEQIREFRPSLCAVANEEAARALSVRIADLPTKILGGKEAVERLAAEAEGDTVLNAVSGIAGLRPTLATLKANKTLALANKESLVTFGTFVMAEAKRRGLSVLPVDSEHSAIFQCLTKQPIKRLILTASGGPFFGKTREELAAITPADALAHPTWNMGSRITIDSATMMNKGFEVIEAAHLFGLPIERVEVTVHRESIIHSMVEYIDSAVIAQLSRPDMRLCVQYALTYPERVAGPVPSLDFTALSGLHFAPPDLDNFPLLPLAYRAFRAGGVAPAMMNGADEEAVALFLKGKLTFPQLFDTVIAVTEDAPRISEPTLADIEEADAEARRRVRALAVPS